MYFGDTVRCDFTISDIDESGRAKAEAVFTNESGVIVVEAVINGILPGVLERQVMELMLDEEDPQGG